MAITRLNNNSITSITALPSAVDVGSMIKISTTTMSSQNTDITLPTGCLLYTSPSPRDS